MSIGFGFGVAGFPFSSADGFLRWIDLLEEHRADSVWFSERLVSPTPTLEPMAAMAVVAGRTTKLKFGMNAIVVSLRDPLVKGQLTAVLSFRLLLRAA